MLNKENTEELDAAVATEIVLIGLTTKSDVPFPADLTNLVTKLTKALTNTEVDEVCQKA